MTQYGPWIQEDDYDAAGDCTHVLYPNDATDFHTSFAHPTPITTGDFQDAWQGAEASTNYIDFGAFIGTLVYANYDGSIIGPYDPTTYDAYHGVDPIYFHVTDTDRWFQSRFTPTVPDGWDGWEWEDGAGYSSITDAVLEEIYVDDRLLSANLTAATWEHQLYGTTDYTPPIPGHVPTIDLLTYSRTIEYALTVNGSSTAGFYQRHVGHNVFDLVTDEQGSVLLVNTHVTASATMAAAVEGTYQWGSFISTIGLPEYTYLRYVLHPPRYRFYRQNRTIPARRLTPRQDGLGIGIGRQWPAPNTPQRGRGIGPASPY